MVLPSRTRLLLAGVLVALLSFALGLLAAGRLGAPSSPVAPLPPDAADGAPPAVEPRLALDPDRVELLPDASLRLDLPQGFGGSSADGSGPR